MEKIKNKKWQKEKKLSEFQKFVLFNRQQQWFISKLLITATGKKHNICVATVSSSHVGWNLDQTETLQLWLSQPADSVYILVPVSSLAVLPQPVFWYFQTIPAGVGGMLYPSRNDALPSCGSSDATRLMAWVAVVVAPFFSKDAPQGFLPWILSVSLKLQLVWKIFHLQWDTIRFFFF